MKMIVTLGFLSLHFASCDIKQAPYPTSTDTIVVKSDAAIFYYPDSASLDTLKSEVDENTFTLAVSDYTHFMNSATRYIDSAKQNRITITRGKVLKFICEDKSEHIIATNTLINFWGVILFKKQRTPKLVDITVFDMEYMKYFY